jgi:hypothetical protein
MIESLSEFIELLREEHAGREEWTEYRIRKEAQEAVAGVQLPAWGIDKAAAFLCETLPEAFPNAKMSMWPKVDWKRLYLNKTDCESWQSIGYLFMRKAGFADNRFEWQLVTDRDHTKRNQNWAYSMVIASAQLLMASVPDNQ